MTHGGSVGTISAGAASPRASSVNQPGHNVADRKYTGTTVGSASVSTNHPPNQASVGFEWHHA